MKINELVDVWDDKDIDNAPKDEKAFRLMNVEKALHVKLRTFYNWDNPFNEILYFYFRDTQEQKMMAVSFGWSDYSKDDGYIISRKEFTFDDHGVLFHDDHGDEPWEIHPGDIQPSDPDSLSGIIEGIFKATDLNIDEGALRFVQ